jgi:serine/threonine protein kinase
LHDQRVIHRDVKPANIFLHEEGNAVLGDLGLCKNFRLSADPGDSDYFTFDADPDATSGRFDFPACETDQWCGTSPFMSPDQHWGRPYSFDADVWALGVSFFYMLTGRVKLLLE